MKIMRYRKYSIYCSDGCIVCASYLIIFIVKSRVWHLVGALYIFFASPLENHKAIIVNGGPLSIAIGILSSITIVILEDHLWNPVW